jgi:hypothetical protein
MIRGKSRREFDLCCRVVHYSLGRKWCRGHCMIERAAGQWLPAARFGLGIEGGAGVQCAVSERHRYQDLERQAQPSSPAINISAPRMIMRLPVIAPLLANTTTIQPATKRKKPTLRTSSKRTAASIMHSSSTSTPLRKAERCGGEVYNFHRKLDPTHSAAAHQVRA